MVFSCLLVRKPLWWALAVLPELFQAVALALLAITVLRQVSVGLFIHPVAVAVPHQT
jgi:hypothetical protein